MLLLGLMIILFSSICHAAAISGIVYDESLNTAKNAIVEINTVPKQTFVAKDGSYSFEVPVGSYVISAKLGELQAAENLTVEKEGNYIIDLIMFPDLDEMPPIEEDIGGSVAEEKTSFNYLFVIVGILLILFFAFYIIIKRGKKPAQGLDEDIDNLVRIIKKQGGRATQKEIRKEIPLSEAKISLMIAELEHKGIVEKIKKGRGNIIILKK